MVDANEARALATFPNGDIAEVAIDGAPAGYRLQRLDPDDRCCGPVPRALRGWVGSDAVGPPLGSFVYDGAGSGLAIRSTADGRLVIDRRLDPPQL